VIGAGLAVSFIFLLCVVVAGVLEIVVIYVKLLVSLY